MILLLDAHALLWWLSDDATLDDAARQSIADPSNDRVLGDGLGDRDQAPHLGKLEAPDRLVATIELAGFGSLPITAADAERAAALPAHHRDPFDRMLVAQAARLDATIVSRDPAFSAYGAPVLPA